MEPAPPAGRRTAGLLILILAVLLSGCSGMIEIEAVGDVHLAPPAQTSVVLAADGSVLAELHAGQDRELVGIERMPAVLLDAVVAVEDGRFHEHGGVDLRAIARAFLENARVGRVTQGGSTITQQLAKNAVTGDEQTLERKLAEASVALQLEQRYSKDEILERYLNTVYFGNGAYGVATAAERYFGVPIEALSLPQAALLVGLLKAPTTYDPYTQPERALARRDLVVRRMVEEGRITQADADAARAAPLGVVPPADRPHRAPWFVDHVLDALQHDRRYSAIGVNATTRADRIFRGGLRIETTLDPEWQAAAEEAVAATLSDAADPRAALVAIAPGDGEIRALVGGGPPSAEDPFAHFNLATKGLRQPGSAFKPLVLATALAEGHTLGEPFPGGAAVELPQPSGQPAWLVENYEGRDPGPLTLEQATAQSVNTVYARLITDVGPEAVVRTAEAAGVRRELTPFASLALGAQEVTPLEMASVQATLASGGLYREPAAVRRILGPDGSVLYDRGTPEAERAIDEAAAALTTRALRRVIAEGTGQRADVHRPLAGKTGTTQDGADAWFTGYTPDLAAAVWIGFPEGRVPMEPPRTRVRVEGGNWPAELFARFALRALAQVPANDFPAPSLPPVDVLMDPARQCVATAVTPETLTVTRSYVPGTEPTTPCPDGPDLRARRTPTPSAPDGQPDGTDRVTVPDVLNLSAGDALAALVRAGLVGNVHGGCPDGSPDCTGTVERPGQVWEQVPDAGATVSPGEQVSLSVYPP